MPLQGGSIRDHNSIDGTVTGSKTTRAYNDYKGL